MKRPCILTVRVFSCPCPRGIFTSTLWPEDAQPNQRNASLMVESQASTAGREGRCFLVKGLSCRKQLAVQLPCTQKHRTAAAGAPPQRSPAAQWPAQSCTDLGLYRVKGEGTQCGVRRIPVCLEVKIFM